MKTASFQTPLGMLEICEADGAITRLHWRERRGGETRTELLQRACDQLNAYFCHDLRDFDLPLRIEASSFQRAVCDLISEIPFGETRTYGEIAQDLASSPQSVGTACGANPIPIFIPCHRVLGARGLGGYSGRGSVETKVWLLRHEGAAGLLI